MHARKLSLATCGKFESQAYRKPRIQAADSAADSQLPTSGSSRGNKEANHEFKLQTPNCRRAVPVGATKEHDPPAIHKWVTSAWKWCQTHARKLSLASSRAKHI